MEKISVKSIAKINFGLRIISKRNDGYHNLQTLFLPIKGLYDEITIKKFNKLNFNSNNKLLNNDSNLIIKAVRLLENEFSQKFNVEIYLNKKIPVGAGLGGGSSNAASTLIALNKLFDLELSGNELVKFALMLGSDVPFFIKPISSVGTSRGEILNPIDFKMDKNILLVNPGIHISTKESFGNISVNDNLIEYHSIIKKGKMNFAIASNHVVNDFENYVFEKYPKVAYIKETMIKNGALFAQMSGTGSTVYGLFDNIEATERAASILPDIYFKHNEYLE